MSATVPTGYYDRLWIEKFIYTKNYWLLRSPVTDGTGWAWQVYPDGGVDYYGYVDNSHGRIISPRTTTNLDAFITTTTGDVSHAGSIFIYAYSYGICYLNTSKRIDLLEV